jgi:serine/threonine-protein kinase RsbW
MPKINAPAKLENMEKLQEFIAEFAEQNGFSVKRIMEIELACEEALSNIFSHAYLDEKEGDIEINCKINNNGDYLVEMSDTGQPFNLNELPDPDVTLGISEREIGGLGSVLMKKFVDEINYRRNENKNCLTFKFSKRD